MVPVSTGGKHLSFYIFVLRTRVIAILRFLGATTPRKRAAVALEQRLWYGSHGRQQAPNIVNT